MSRSSLDGIVHSRVGVCGLEILGRIDRKTKEMQTHWIVQEGNSMTTEYRILLHLFSIYYIPQTKTGEEGKTCFNMNKGQPEQLLASILEFL